MSEEGQCDTGCPDGPALDALDLCTEQGTVDVTGGPEDQLASPAGGADPEVPQGTDPDDLYGARLRQTLFCGIAITCE